MKNLKIITLAFVLLSIYSYGQNEIDALRYSFINYGGTARYVGMGGAFGALGADFSTLSTNPAGLGVFRSSEFSFSPSIYTEKSLATHYGKGSEDLKYNFNLGNLGFISAFKLRRPHEEGPGWEYINFGFGVNRYANYHSRILLEGDNWENSLMTDYLERALGKNPEDFDPFGTQLAWETYLLDPIDSSGTNYGSAVPVGGGVRQSKSITKTGAINELVISLAGNYDDKFYIGGTLGFPFVRFNESSTYREEDIDTISNFKSFTLNEDLMTSGSGVNFKLGMIYKPIEFVRIGAAVHTPTFFTMKDEYSRVMQSYFDNGNNYSATSPDGKFDYELTTPMRVIGSLAFIIGEYGLLSADYEFVDYSEARLRSKSYKFFDENEAIQMNYKAQSNIRIGGEVRLDPINIRGGYALYGSPYNKGLNDAEKTSISFGVGIRDKHYFLDVAYVYSECSEDYYLYNPNLVKPSNIKLTSNNIILTLGLKF
ncbi:MAG: hypothetical protein PHT69_16720 [Bacteroidales bacterium]|nr:hypothetical protein [Bacteroidales bacterium]